MYQADGILRAFSEKNVVRLLSALLFYPEGGNAS